MTDTVEVSGIDISDLIYSWALVNTTGQDRRVEVVLQAYDTVKINGKTVAEILGLDTPSPPVP